MSRPHDAPPPAAVYLLADHLDAALAAGEDLIKAGLTWRRARLNLDERAEADARQAERDALDDIRTYELLIVARILQARDRAREVAAADQNFAMIANLFAAGTTNLRDILAECGENARVDFDTGSSTTRYIRSRGLIDPECAGIANEGLQIKSRNCLETHFLLAAHLPLGVLMDNAATFLDALDIAYELYDDDTTAPISGPTETDQPSRQTYVGATVGNPFDTAGSASPRDTLAERLSRLQ